MAEVEAPGSQATQHQQHQRPHGTKRPAEAGLENEQRLSKRFDLLNLLDSNGTPCRFYIPVAGSSDTATQSSKPLPRPIAPVTQRKRERRPRPPPADDGMQVEDTPDRVYIHDLAAELSDIESDEENPIFLSDIEKHLAKIPKHVLAAPELKPTRDNQLILYNVPSSLTVPEEQDRVRKAIVEARARIRDKQANPVSEPAATFNGDGALHTSGQGIAQGSLSVMSDPDAMDLDD